jgi:hypothetical protein
MAILTSTGMHKHPNQIEQVFFAGPRWIGKMIDCVGTNIECFRESEVVVDLAPVEVD